MRSLIFAGIQRYSLFSPNHVGNDAAIFSAVAQYLKENGHQVNMYTEQEFLTNSLKDEKYIFTMMRSKASVRKLQKLEEKLKDKLYGCVESLDKIEQYFL